MPGALQDVHVIDFTHALAGPFCAMLLGHLGADIIKVEPPNGDDFRRMWMPPGATRDAYESLWINVNKKSVVLNLKNPKGVDLARRLIARAGDTIEHEALTNFLVKNGYARVSTAVSGLLPV